MQTEPQYSVGEIETWRERKFDGCTKAQLLIAAEHFGVPGVKATFSERNMIQKLMDGLGEFVEVPPDAPLTVAKVHPEFNAVGSTAPPNLGPGGTWGGRMHKVKVTSLLSNSGNPIKSMNVTWETFVCPIVFGTWMEVPEPIFEVLKGAVSQRYRKEARLVNGEKLENESLEPYYDFTVEYGGVTPKTAHLCGSLKEWYQRYAEHRNYFANFTREALEDIYGALYMQVPKDSGNWNKHKFRFKVLEFLGPEFVAVMRSKDEEELPKEVAA